MSPTTSSDRDLGRRALRAAASTALVAVAVLLLILEGRVLLVLLCGILFALALKGTSGVVARWTHLPYRAVLAVLAALLVAGLGLGIGFLGAGVAREVSALGHELPKAWHSFVEAIRRQPALAQAVGPIDDKAPTVPAHFD